MAVCSTSALRDTNCLASSALAFQKEQEDLTKVSSGDQEFSSMLSKLGLKEEPVQGDGNWYAL